MSQQPSSQPFGRSVLHAALRLILKLARSRFFKIGHEIGMVVVVLLGAVAFYSAGSAFNMANWSLRVHEATAQMQALDTELASLEAIQQKTLIEQKIPLDALNEAERKLEPELKSLHELLNETPLQSSQVHAFTESVQKLLTLLHSPVNQRGNIENISILELFKKINAQFRDMKKTKSELFMARVTESRGAAITTFITIGIGFAIALFLLAITRSLLVRDLQAIRSHQTELRKANEEAEQASRYKSRFLANFSHEIRTPMNAVLGMANLLLRNNPRPDQKEYCETIRHSGQSLVRILQDTLDLSRIEAGKLTFDIAPFDPRRFLSRVCDILQPSLNESVRLKTIVDERLPAMLAGDSGRIQQILLNLGSNAAKFTDQGEIAIHITLPDDKIKQAGEAITVRFSVTDTGLGIPQSALSRLFEPFSQVSPSSAREKLGTGLGLSICKRLVEAMDGSIEVESEAGRGSNFSFDLPLEISAETVTGSLTAERDDYDVTAETLHFSGRVLVIDDNLGNLKVAELTLQSLGLEVATSIDPETGVEMARQGFDMILMDCEMPVMDGFMATQMIRKEEAGIRYTPIVAFTAHAASETQQKCYENGMDDFLTKPLDFEHLIAVVGRFLTPVVASQAPFSSVAKTSVLPTTSLPEEVIDFEIIQSLRNLTPPRGEFDSSNQVIEELLRLFNASIERSLTKLGESVRIGDSVKLASEAHYLKSSSTSVGAVRMTRALQGLEKLKTVSPLPEDVHEKLSELKHECLLAQNELQRWCEQERIAVKQ